MMFEAIASLSALVGVIFLSIQLVLMRKQNRTAFEDSLNREYKEIIRCIPYRILLKTSETTQEVDKKKIDKNVDEQIYNYLDLTNYQIFLRIHGRIDDETWEFWRDGIEHNLSLPHFQRVWKEVKNSSNDDFKELKMLELDYSIDPRKWKCMSK